MREEPWDFGSFRRNNHVFDGFRQPSPGRFVETVLPELVLLAEIGSHLLRGPGDALLSSPQEHQPEMAPAHPTLVSRTHSLCHSARGAGLPQLTETRFTKIQTRPRKYLLPDHLPTSTGLCVGYFLGDALATKISTLVLRKQHGLLSRNGQVFSLPHPLDSAYKPPGSWGGL